MILYGDENQVECADCGSTGREVTYHPRGDSTVTTNETCWNCGGAGYFEVNEDKTLRRVNHNIEGPAIDSPQFAREAQAAAELRRSWDESIGGSVQASSAQEHANLRPAPDRPVSADTTKEMT